MKIFNHRLSAASNTNAEYTIYQRLNIVLTIMLKFLRQILQLLISPSKGWEDVSATGTPPAEITRKGFYPLLGVLAATSLIRLAYHDIGYSLVDALQNAIVSFTIYFVTLFIASYCFSMFMPTIGGKANSVNKNSSFIIFCLGTLALINLVANLIPVDLVLMKILPAYVAFIMFKATIYLDILPDKIGQFMFLSVFSIGVPPFLLSFLFKLLMPEA